MTLAQSAVLVWALAAACFDVRARRIPNGLTLGAWLVGVVVLLASGRGTLGAAPLSCLEAVGLAMLVTLPAWLARMLGAGDVKLAMGIGLLGGLRVLVTALVVAGLVAGVMVVLHFFTERFGASAQMRLPSSASVALPVTPRRLPFGVALAAGVAVAVLMPG